MGSNLATHQVLRSKVLKPWLQPFSPPAPKLQRHCHSCWCAWLVGRVYSLNMVDLGEWLRQDKTGVIKIGELKKVRKPDWLRASHWDGPTWLAIFGSCNVKKREKGGVCWCFFDIHLDVYPLFRATISHNIPYIHLAEATRKSAAEVLENKCHIHDEDATRIFQASLADFGGDIDVLLWMSRNQHHSVVIFEYDLNIIYI